MMEGKKRACLGGDLRSHHQTAPCDWSAMPPEILRIIAGLIDGIEDYIRFGAVCKPWNSATFSSYDDLPRSSKRRLEYPWLMLAPRPWLTLAPSNMAEDKKWLTLAPSNMAVDKRRGFYSLRTGKEFYLDLPEIYEKVCIGTPCGRLLTIDTHCNMHLFNPLTRQQLPLPSLTTTDPYYRDPREPPYPSHEAIMSVHQALVVWDDNTPIVFVTHWHKNFAMARAGDSCWTNIIDTSSCSDIFSIHLFRGQVLFRSFDRINMVDLSLSPPRLKEFGPCPLKNHTKRPLYLVDMGGDLHALVSTPKRHREYYLTQKFSVFKFNMVEKSWERVHTLGGWTAFVGRNSSFAVPSLKNYSLCKPNSIYFTDDRKGWYFMTGGTDWGIFCVEPRSDEETEESEVETEESEVEASEGEATSEGEAANEEEGEEEVDLNVMSRCPFALSSHQFSKYCPPLWLAPNLW